MVKHLQLLKSGQHVGDIMMTFCYMVHTLLIKWLLPIVLLAIQRAGLLYDKIGLYMNFALNVMKYSDLSGV